MDAKQTLIEPFEPRRLFSASASPLPPEPWAYAPVIVMRGPVFGDAAPLGAPPWGPSPDDTASITTPANATPSLQQPAAVATPMATPAVADPPSAAAVVAPAASPVNFATAVTPVAPAVLNDAESFIAAAPAAGIDSASTPTVATAATVPQLQMAAPVEASWTAAARAAVTGLSGWATLDNSPFAGAGAGAANPAETPAWLGGFAHRFAAASLPEVANTVVRAMEQGVTFATTEAEHLLSAAVEHADVTEALAAIFAGGAFTAWWLDGRDDDRPAAATPPTSPFCDRLVGFGRA